MTEKGEQLCFDDSTPDLPVHELRRAWPGVPNARLPLDLQLHKPVRTIRVQGGVL